jgi:FkbM family methyltransferase
MSIIGNVQWLLGQSRLATRMAIKIRNQCNMIIGSHLSNSHLQSDSGEEWLAQHIAPSTRFFVDIGANVGAWTLMFARHMQGKPAGMLFEPNPETATHLSAILARNKLHSCQVVQAAASDIDGRAKFYAEDLHGETSSLYSPAVHTNATMVEVPTCRLDTVLKARNISTVDVLKIDAEGHDFFVMLGAQSYIAARRISLLQFEYNTSWVSAGATLTRAFDFLASNGYKVRLLRGNNIYDLDLGEIGEFFYYSNFVAYCPSPLGDIIERLPCRSVL